MQTEIALALVRSALLFLAFILAFGIEAIGAQQTRSISNYPDRPIRFIVPFPPAGANDILARMVGQKLSSAWGQPVIIDNRPGAGGVTGTAIAAKTAPDGHTIVLVPATHAINVSLYTKPPYDAVVDFAPIVLLATAPYMLVVNPSVPVRSLKELIALAKSKPGQLNYGSVGIGNATHLMGELLKSMAGIDLTHVPYKGGAIALSEVIGGQVQLYFGTTSTIQPQAKAGKVRPLAVTALKRSPSMPEVPTIDEAGVPGYDAAGWWGVLAPARTPAGIVNKLNGEIVAIIGSAEVQRFMREQGFEPAAGNAEDFARHLKNEIDKWSTVVKISGARPE